MAKSNPAGDALTAEEISQGLRELAGLEPTAEGGYVEDYVEIVCSKGCGKKQRHKVRIPVKGQGVDPKTRLRAYELALEHGYGKPGTAKDDQSTVDLDLDITNLDPEARTALRRALLAKQPELGRTATAATNAKR